MFEQIKREITADHFYSQNFPNDGQRFVAWYLRRVFSTGGYLGRTSDNH